MKFWPSNALTTMKNEEDKAFLLSMMSDRKASMSGKDKASAVKEKKKNCESNKKRLGLRNVKRRRN